MVNLTRLNNIISHNIEIIHHFFNIILITGDIVQVLWLYIHELRQCMAVGDG